jgi:hypothetical protein
LLGNIVGGEHVRSEQYHPSLITTVLAKVVRSTGNERMSKRSGMIGVGEIKSGEICAWYG